MTGLTRFHAAGPFPPHTRYRGRGVAAMESAPRPHCLHHLPRRPGVGVFLAFGPGGVQAGINPTPAGAFRFPPSGGPSSRGANPRTERDQRRMGHPSAVACVVLLAMLAGPGGAAAANECSFGTPGTTVQIRPHAEAWAEVVIHNRLSAKTRVGPCLLDHAGQTVGVIYEPGQYTIPDEFMILPPDGYTAEPDWLVVDDGASVSVLIWPFRDGAGV